jgi:hypothetical protein
MIICKVRPFNANNNALEPIVDKLKIHIEMEVYQAAALQHLLSLAPLETSDSISDLHDTLCFCLNDPEIVAQREAEHREICDDDDEPYIDHTPPLPDWYIEYQKKHRVKQNAI